MWNDLAPLLFMNQPNLIQYKRDFSNFYTQIFCIILSIIHTGHRCPPFTEISILFYEGIIKKISYERCAYESVDEKSLS